MTTWARIKVCVENNDESALATIIHKRLSCVVFCVVACVGGGGYSRMVGDDRNKSKTQGVFLG